MKLFIDDIREAPDDTWIVVRNYDEAIRCLETGLISEISFDHDLGENSKSGYDIICWIERKFFKREWEFVPKMYCHSMNPVGRKNIEMVINTISLLTSKRR